MFKTKEKFIIHTAMGQDEIWKKLEENIRSYKSWYDSLPAEENKEFVGKLQGQKFEMTRTLAMSKGRQSRAATPNPKIKGEVINGSIIVEIEPEIYITIGFYAVIAMLAGAFLTALLVFLKHGIKSAFFGEQIYIIFGFIALPFMYLVRYRKGSNEKISNEKEFLKNLFNGTIEEINTK